MNSPDSKLLLPALRIAEARPSMQTTHQWELSLKDIGPEGANVSIQPTPTGSSKDRLQIYIDRNLVVDFEFDNKPPQVINTRISKAALLKHLGIMPIHYMIRIDNGVGDMGETETYLITH